MNIINDDGQKADRLRQEVALIRQEVTRIRQKDSRKFLGIGSSQFYKDAQTFGWKKQPGIKPNEIYYLVPWKYVEERQAAMEADKTEEVEVDSVLIPALRETIEILKHQADQQLETIRNLQDSLKHEQTLNRALMVIRAQEHQDTKEKQGIFGLLRRLTGRTAAI